MTWPRRTEHSPRSVSSDHESSAIRCSYDLRSVRHSANRNTAPHHFDHRFPRSVLSLKVGWYRHVGWLSLLFVTLNLDLHSRLVLWWWRCFLRFLGVRRLVCLLRSRGCFGDFGCGRSGRFGSWRRRV